MVVLAEIGDKMPTVLSTVLISATVAAIALGLSRLRWWLALLALPVFGLWNWMVFAELQEPGFGNQIWSEMGTGYVVGQFAAINVPAMLGALGVVWMRRAQVRHRRRTTNLCPHCGYPQGAERCPECGQTDATARDTAPSS